MSLSDKDYIPKQKCVLRVTRSEQVCCGQFHPLPYTASCTDPYTQFLVQTLKQAIAVQTHIQTMLPLTARQDCK